MSNGLDMLDKLQDALLEDRNKKESKPQYKFDKLKMYFGEDFNYKGIIISMPTIGDILEIGENKFFDAISPFTHNSTSIRVLLWDNGLDWNKVKDIEVFNILYNFVQDKSPQNILFKNFSFENFKIINYKDAENEEIKFALYNKSSDILIEEYDFMVIANYIREIFNMHPKEERAKGKTAKKWIIQEEKMNLSEKKEKNTSTLLPLVSTCINHPGFKYKLNELKEVGIYQFMDSVKRIQKIETGTAAIRGAYSGFVDVKKIDKEILNYMGDL